jgi:HEAT repeat protein
MVLGDSHRSIRAAAAESLGAIGASDERSIAVLAQCLSDRHRIVRVAAAKALGKLGRAAMRRSGTTGTLLHGGNRLTFVTAAIPSLCRVIDVPDPANP